jgi:hypothetical protein
MRILFTILILFMSACGQREVLVDNNWILIGGTFKGKTIEFETTDPIVFTDQDGQVIKWLNFDEDQTIILPGINSRNISARWAAEGNEIRFSIDSMRYSIRTFDPNIFSSADSIEYDGTTAELKELEEAMQIYGQVFKYNISRDTLWLLSQDVALKAVRDRRIDDLFKNGI